MFFKKYPGEDVVRRMLMIMLPAMALVSVTYLPPFNPHGSTVFDLTGPVPLAAYWVSASGGVYGIPIVVLLMTALLVSRPGIPGRQRVTEGAILVVSAGLLGVLPRFNEHLLKTNFAVPRPNIRELASSPSDAPALGKTAEDFYKELPDKPARSKYLKTVKMPPMHEEIREHWIHETGYSFPSGHSFSSMMFATLFLCLGLRAITGPRRWFFYLLAPWGAAVCISRPILRVHSPTDVLLGGLEGVALGCVAFLFMNALLPPVSREEPVRANAPCL